MNISFDDVLYIVELAMPFVIAGAITLYQIALSRMPERRRTQIEKIVTTVVTGVEQYGNYKQASNDQKKVMAIKLVDTLLTDAKLPINPQLVDILIEAAVAALPPTHPTPPTTPTTPQ